MKVPVSLPEIPTVGNPPANLEEIRDGLKSGLFTATPSQKRQKAAFWARYLPGPNVPLPENLTIAYIQELTGSPSIRKWWPEQGFRQWFLNRDEAREQVEYLFERSLEIAEDLLMSESAKPGEKVALIKFLAELAGKMPKAGDSKNSERFADADIAQMDENQLKAFLTRKGVLLGKAEKLEVNPVINATIIEPIEDKQK